MTWERNDSAPVRVTATDKRTLAVDGAADDRVAG